MKNALADQVAFNDDEHCKAWLIRVTANVCKDMLKAASRRAVSLDDAVCAASNDRPRSPHHSPARWWTPCTFLDDPPRTPCVFLCTRLYGDRADGGNRVSREARSCRRCCHETSSRVRQAFDNVTVPDDVKRGTRTYSKLRRRLAFRRKRLPQALPHHGARIIPLRRAAAALAACLALAFAGFGGFAYAQPTTYVGIDVNPSTIERPVWHRRSGRGAQRRWGVIARCRVATGRGYADALSRLTQSDAFSPYAQEDSYIESVTSDDARQAEAIRQQSDACMSALPCRGSCHAVDEGTREAAVSAGMGVGRYRAALELVELDPSVTLQECASLSMRELRDRIAALSSGDSEGRGSGNGQHGHGGGRQRNR